MKYLAHIWVGTWPKTCGSVTSFVAVWTCLRGLVDVSLTVYPFYTTCIGRSCHSELRQYCFSSFSVQKGKTRVGIVTLPPSRLTLPFAAIFFPPEGEQEQWEYSRASSRAYFARRRWEYWWLDWTRQARRLSSTNWSSGKLSPQYLLLVRALGGSELSLLTAELGIRYSNGSIPVASLCLYIRLHETKCYISRSHSLSEEVH